MNVMSGSQSQVCYFLYSWGPLRAAVPESNSLSQRSFKIQTFGMKILLYLHMFMIHEKEKHMLIDSHLLYQRLFSVSYSYLTKDKYFSPGEWLSIGTDC